MLSILARGCPPGPFPGWCDATWTTYTAHPAPSWWTPLHIALAALIAAGTIGLIADVRHRLAIRRPQP